MKTLYKVLKDGKSCHGGDLQWSLPKPDGTPGDWHHAGENIELCRGGFHLTEEPDRWFLWGCDVYKAEGRDFLGERTDPHKAVFAHARLLQLMPKPKWQLHVESFVGSLATIKWYHPDGKPLPEWRHYTRKTLSAARAAARDAARNAAWAAARNAAWDAARDAARNAAWAAAWDAARAAAWAAARDAARNAAWAAAWDAAWAAARDAAGNAAWAAARDAAGDAIVMAAVIVSGIKGDHLNHSKARMKVWQKGYCLLCDVNGVLYTYSKKQ